MNIIYLMADDMGWADVGYNGADLQTPSIDAFAAESTVLTRFHTHPVCTASRVSLIAGKYPHKVGLADAVIRAWHMDKSMPLEQMTLAEHLQTAGYVTACVGKWHLGHGSLAMLPCQRGFDHFYGIYGGACDYWTKMRHGEIDFHVNNSPAVDEGYVTELLGHHAVHIVEEHDFADPLFLYVPFSAPHSPLQAEQSDIDHFDGIIEHPQRKVYAAQVLSMDRQVGVIIQALKDRGQWDNSVVVFCTDNGGETKLGLSAGDNRPHRGDKGQLWNGGIRGPAVMHYPGQNVEVSDALLHIIDLHKTALDVAGVNAESDGKNAHGVVMGTVPRNWLLVHYDAVSWAFFRRGYKYIKTRCATMMASTTIKSMPTNSKTMMNITTLQTI